MQPDNRETTADRMRVTDQDAPDETTTTWTIDSSSLYIYGIPMTCSHGEHWFANSSVVCACGQQSRFPFDSKMAEFNRLKSMGVGC